MTPFARAVLRAGPDKHVANGHPWVFRGAITELTGAGTASGTVTDVLDSEHAWIGRGVLNPEADLAIRVFTWDEDEILDEAFFLRRIDRAVAWREQLFGGDGAQTPETNAYRLVYSESDGLSGLIVDRYASAVTIQVRAKMWEPHIHAVARRLKERTAAERVHVQVAPDHAAREHIDPERFQSLADASDQPIPFRESGFDFEIEPGPRQKTGFYLDQRENRRRVAAYAQGRRVLSGYCYGGAFEVHAARAGARSIVGIDVSDAALAQARRHHERNGTSCPVEYRNGDVPHVLRRFRDSRETFDLVILDPPRFVVSHEQKTKGLRAYKDINLLAMKLLTDDGILASFSCSGLVSTEEFGEAIRWAAQDSGRTVRIVETLGQPPDHPILATFPESRYLKGVICHVTGSRTLTRLPRRE